MSAFSPHDIAQALGGRKHGSYWTAKCPAHDDQHPSLSISEASDGAVLVKCHAGCSQDMVIDALRDRGLWPEREAREPKISRSPKTKKVPSNPSGCGNINRHSTGALQIWRESLEVRGTRAEDYLASRGLVLPADPEILLRTLRFHPRCPWGQEVKPALICAFTPILTGVPDDPCLDPPPVAIHRIRGRGHDNKKMLGPVKGSCVMISPWWHVWDTLNVCEGVETALALYNEGAADLDDCHRPVWALGSAGAIATLPVVSRVKRLVIWADHDRNGTSLANARHCAHRWQQAGKHVVIRTPENEGEDYAD
jgi:putative DNA primase/helicase